MTKDFFNTRPLSWSALSSFAYDPEQWYSRYIQNQRQPENAAMRFGKEFALSCEKRAPLAKVRLLKEVEYPLNTLFLGIKMIGFIDTYEPHKALGEFKTANVKSSLPWTQEKVDAHGQIDMYLLQLYIQHEVKPESVKCYLQVIDTLEDADFKVSFTTSPPSVHTYKTKRTMADILRFGAYINKTVEEMIAYANSKQKI